MRKIAVISLLLLANICLLAHSVIPHHHHNRAIVSLFNSVCASVHRIHDHSDEASGHGLSTAHQHDGRDTDECFIDNTFTLVERQAAASVTSIEKSIPLLLLFFCSEPVSAIYDDANLPFRHRPYLAAAQSQYVSRILGLRAPPVC